MTCIKIKRQYTICSIQRLNHHNPGSNPLALLCYLTHRSSLMLLECFNRLQPFSLRRLMTAFAPLFTGLCHHSDLHGLVVFFRRLRVHSLLVLKAAPEEGEHGVQHVVLTLGGGNIVSFIWENLGSRKQKTKCDSLKLVFHLFHLLFLTISNVFSLHSKC